MDLRNELGDWVRFCGFRKWMSGRWERKVDFAGGGGWSSGGFSLSPWCPRMELTHLFAARSRSLREYSSSMNYSLVVLVFCGSLAPAANVCEVVADAHHLETPFPQRGSDLGLWDTSLPASRSFRVQVKTGGPSFLITVRSFNVRVHNNASVRKGEIEVARCQGGQRVQVLPILAGRPFDFGKSFRTFDINFDGCLDLSVIVEVAGTYISQSWWIYDSARGKFVQNGLTRGLREVTSNGYRVDERKRELLANHLMYGCPELVTRYRIEGHRLVKIHWEEPFQGDECVITYHDLVGGQMKVTGKGRFKNYQPVK